MRPTLKIAFVVSLALLFLCGSGSAQETKPRSFHCIEALSGWGQASLKTKQDYHFIPVFIDFDFDLKSSKGTWCSSYWGLLQFQVEPFFSLVLQPEHNFEAGTSFLLKAGLLPDTYQLQPYVKAGIGGIGMTQHTDQQATQINFVDTLGVGTHYFFDDQSGVTFEFRFRHLSNGGIKSPNKGLGSYLTLCGFSHKF